MRRSRLISEIDQLTVLELADLVKQLEEKYGVSAAARRSPSPPAAAAVPAADFDIILEEAGAEKINVINAVSEVTSLGLMKPRCSSRARPSGPRKAFRKTKPRTSPRSFRKPAQRSPSGNLPRGKRSGPVAQRLGFFMCRDAPSELVARIAQGNRRKQLLKLKSDCFNCRTSPDDIWFGVEPLMVTSKFRADLCAPRSAARACMSGSKAVADGSKHRQTAL